MESFSTGTPKPQTLDLDEEIGLEAAAPSGPPKPPKAPKEIPKVNHAEIEYPPFQRVFYSNEDPECSIPDISLSHPLRPICEWQQGGFSRPILEYLAQKKYTAPTPVQSVATAAILGGHDLMAIAQTGSGKTLAFVLPMLRHVQSQTVEPKGPIAIVLSPTRELCAQIYTETWPIAQSVKVGVCCAYGGSDIKPQIDQLRRGGVHIIIATPGRLIDLLAANKGRVLSTLKTSLVVIDEADRMFDMGFSPQIYKIMDVIRPDKQTVLCSATFSSSMQALANRTLKNPVLIQVGQNSRVGDHIKQEFKLLDPPAKLPELLKVLERVEYDQAIVFVDRQELADDIATQLIFKGYKCTSLHGGKAQSERDGSLQEFREGQLDLLVATSVAARGIDVRTVGLVVNFDPPNHLEDYVHRVGRTGRAGEPGHAVTFFSPGQFKQAFEVARAFTKPPAEIRALALEYKQPIYAREGFGGKGLTKLDQFREQAKQATQAGVAGEVGFHKRAVIEKTTAGFRTTLEFNDFPPAARKPLMKLATQAQISEEYNVSLTIKGQYNKFGDKLRMIIDGQVKEAVLNAHDEFTRLLVEGVQQAQASSTRYQV